MTGLYKVEPSVALKVGSWVGVKVVVKVVMLVDVMDNWKVVL
jgi:hypothetical protein